MELVFWCVCVCVLFLPLLNWEITLTEKKDGKLTKGIILGSGVLVNPHFLFKAAILYVHPLELPNL